MRTYAIAAKTVMEQRRYILLSVTIERIVAYQMVDTLTESTWKTKTHDGSIGTKYTGFWLLITPTGLLAYYTTPDERVTERKIDRRGSNANMINHQVRVSYIFTFLSHTRPSCFLSGNTNRFSNPKCYLSGRIVFFLISSISIEPFD